MTRLESSHGCGEGAASVGCDVGVTPCLDASLARKLAVEVARQVSASNGAASHVRLSGTSVAAFEVREKTEGGLSCSGSGEVNTVGELLEKTEDDLLAITNFGQKSLDEVIEKLDERGLTLRTRD